MFSSLPLISMLSIGKARGFPELLYFGKCAKIDCLVMELLGPNLEEWLASKLGSDKYSVLPTPDKIFRPFP